MSFDKADETREEVHLYKKCETKLPIGTQDHPNQPDNEVEQLKKRNYRRRPSFSNSGPFASPYRRPGDRQSVDDEGRTGHQVQATGDDAPAGSGLQLELH